MALMEKVRNLGERRIALLGGAALALAAAYAIGGVQGSQAILDDERSRMTSSYVVMLPMEGEQGAMLQFLSHDSDGLALEAAAMEDTTIPYAPECDASLEPGVYVMLSPAARADILSCRERVTERLQAARLSEDTEAIRSTLGLTGQAPEDSRIPLACWAGLSAAALGGAYALRKRRR